MRSRNNRDTIQYLLLSFSRTIKECFREECCSVKDTRDSEMLISHIDYLNAITYSEVAVLWAEVIFCSMLYQNAVNSGADYSWEDSVCQT